MVLLAPVRTHVVVASRLLSLFFFRGAYVHERTVGRLSGRVVNELISRCVWSIWRASFPFSTPRLPRSRTHHARRPFSLFPPPLSSHLSATPTFNTRRCALHLIATFFSPVFLLAPSESPFAVSRLSFLLSLSLSPFLPLNNEGGRQLARNDDDSRGVLLKNLRGLLLLLLSPPPPSTALSSSYGDRALRAICILYFALAACRS